MSEDPVTKLVYAILLSSLKKQADRVTMRCDYIDLVVTFTIAGREIEEMRPPIKLHRAIFDRLREMGDGGYMHIKIGDVANAFFTVDLRDENGWRVAEITSISAEQYPHAN